MHERIFIIAPVGNDAKKMAELLGNYGFQSAICGEFTECCGLIKEGAGVLLLTEESLEIASISHLWELLKAQPAWSELPLIILTSGGQSRLIKLLNVTAEAARSVTLLERPISIDTLIRSVEVALRSRKRQYQVRDLIDEIEANNRGLQQLAAIIESSEDAIISKDLNGIITSWNLGAEKIFGYKADEVIGKHVTLLIPPDRRNEEPVILEKIVRGERIHHFDTVRQRKDGTLIDISLTISPIKGPKGIIGASKIARDITGRKKTEAELKEFSSMLEKRVEERTRILEAQTIRLRELAVELTEVEQKERRRLAEVLHDHLQQYLVAAKMRIDLMERRGGMDSSSFQEARSLINQAIDASRQLTAELRPPVLYEGGLNAGLRYLRQKMENQHKVKIHLIVTEDAEPSTDITKFMLYQCIQELLFNAVKYAMVKEYSVTVRRLKDSKIEASVEDKGIGFDVTTAGTNSKGGFGLFSIRERVRAMGGELQISSVPGQGSLFKLIVPDKVVTDVPEIKDLPEEKIFKKDKSEDKGIVVLVVDDHSIIRQSMASLLIGQPFIKKVIEAGTGEEALQKVEAADPDIILMDVNMPGMNGIEATQILCHRNPLLKIIGLSVQPEEEIAQTMKEAGAIAYFNKGDDTARLIETIKKFSQN